MRRVRVIRGLDMQGRAVVVASVSLTHVSRHVDLRCGEPGQGLGVEGHAGGRAARDLEMPDLRTNALKDSDDLPGGLGAIRVIKPCPRRREVVEYGHHPRRAIRFTTQLVELLHDPLALVQSADCEGELVAGR